MSYAARFASAPPSEWPVRNTCAGVKFESEENLAILSYAHVVVEGG